MTTQRIRARLAVSGLFLLNGAAFANLVSRYPELTSSLGLSNIQFGIAVAAYPLGALIAGALGGVLLARWGSARVAWVSTVLLCANLLVIGFAQNVWMLGAGFAIAGALDASADVAENAQGLRVERLFGRSVLNSMHGLWSVGAVLGGIMGAAAIGLNVPTAWHLTAVAVVFIGLAVTAARSLLAGSDARPDEVSPAASSSDAGPAAPTDVTSPAARADGADPPRPRLRAAAIRALLALGLIAASANLMEDAAATWSGLYLTTGLGGAAAIATFGFVALQASQTLGRFLGDGLVTRFGDRLVARVGAGLAGVAMTVSLALPSVVTTIAALAVVGLGIGTLIPGAIRTAEALPGVSPGVGIAWVATTTRVALLVSPPLIGAIADLFSLRVAFGIVPVAAAVILLLSRALGAAPIARVTTAQR
jgi:MFS family permease